MSDPAPGAAALAGRDGPPPGATPPYADWGPWIALGGAIGALVVGLVLALPFVVIDNPAQGEDLSTWAAVGSQAATAVGFLLVPAIVAAQGGATFAWALRKLGFNRFRLLNGLKWVGLAVLAYIVVLSAYSAVFGQPHQDDISTDFGPVPVQIALIVVLAPLSEEVCFRGLLYGGFRTRLPWWAAALLAGLVFGLLHLTTGPSAVPPLIFFGIVLCVLYEKTGSIWPGVLLHALNNALALLIT